MSFSIALLQDDFTNNTIDPVWTTAITGSATVAETGGQARITLPSATAGTHQSYYRSTATYDLTGAAFYWNIGTMVATGVAATAAFDLVLDGSNLLRWRQLSNAITARTFVAGVDTQLFTATWSSSTYKYLRIRESAGTIFFDSSTNGTSWTNRASVANPFAVTSFYVQFVASCGNVASPGSLRLDDVNLTLPAPSSTWRFTTADWSITNRLKPVTLASDGGKQGVLVTADTMDSAGTLGGTVRYFAGPLGSTSGGYLQLTEYASLVLAQASPFPVPVDGRVDLPAMVDARYMRLYHRSTDASAHTIYEFVPRRIVQADDIEAESIEAINIAAGAVTADKIFVLDLSAITATIGQLTIASADGSDAWLFAGTGTGASPTTGLKLYEVGGIGKLSGYNAGVEQATLDTDGRIKAGAGLVVLDATGVRLQSGSGSSSRLTWYDTVLGTDTLATVLATPVSTGTLLSLSSSFGSGPNTVQISAVTPAFSAEVVATSDNTTTGNKIQFKLNSTVKAMIDNAGSIHPPRSSGSAAYAIDTTDMGSAISLANNATATPFSNANVFGGLILINETLTFGSPGLFLTGGGGIVEIADPGAKYSTTAAAAGTINVYLVGSVVTVENKTGSSISLNVCGFRNRTSN